MESTRQRILEIMKTRQRVSSRELARLTHFTPANIRHHLRQLIEDGLVRKTGETIVEGRGRPTPLYTLTHPTTNLSGLARQLLHLIKEEPDRLQALATGFAPAQPDARRHITQRLVAAMQRLGKLSYEPRWEPHPDGPLVILGNCPFSEIIADHPELCTMDAHLLERLLGEKPVQTEKLERNAEGMVVCKFRIRSL